MSVQAGIWNIDHATVKQPEMRAISALSAQYGPDGEAFHCDGELGMLFRPHHTTPESRCEDQPFISATGKIVTWDGRIDNREELKTILSNEVRGPDSDLAIAAAAVERWGTDAFQRIRGDWATAIWDPRGVELVLARDYIGVRQMFYYPTASRITWCTCLTPLVLSGGPHKLCDEYVAGYLAFHPDADLTPYREILSVPPGSFVRIRQSSRRVHSYWRFNTRARTRYKTDREYEEQYRHLFRQAVRRRLRANSPVLSELSGGLDSSSIVCMADDLLLRKEATAPRVDTFSYYDSNEPGEDDYPYFSQVENKRGQAGFHVDLKGAGNSLPLEYSTFPPTPGFGTRAEIKSAFNSFIGQREYRVMLSGVGGDELNGQPLNPCILLNELLLKLRLFELGRTLTLWSFRLRRPWIQLLFQTFLQSMPALVRVKFAEIGELEPWLDNSFARRHNVALRQLEEVKRVGVLRPMTRDALQTIETLRRQLTCTSPSLIEKRYPYLDQDLVEFLTSIPPDQLLRPGERRSLMRRSLAGLLPREITTRKTKTGAGRCYPVALERNWDKLRPFLSKPLIADLGYVNQEKFCNALDRMRNGVVPRYFLRLLKALSLELWLREVTSHGVLAINPLPSSELCRDHPFTVIKNVAARGSRIIT